LRVTVYRSSLSGSLQAPPSKSYTHRALFCSALAEGESTLRRPLLCDDTRATSDALRKIGVTVDWNESDTRVSRYGQLKRCADTIMCGESGTTLRFMTGICATAPHDAEISGEPSLLRRPVGDLAVALETIGAYCTSNQGYPPVRVRGPIKGGAVKISGSATSQYLSSILLAAPSARAPVDVRMAGRLESKPYVQMTLDMQEEFGVHIEASEDLREFHVHSQAYRPSDVEIEGDWSSAAPLLAGAAIVGDTVRVLGLEGNSLQADRYLLDILKQMRAKVTQDSSSVTAKESQIATTQVDVSDCPDLFPVICVLCASAEGTSTITGIHRLRIKESNRVRAMSDGLKAMGIRTEESEDSFTINGGKPRNVVINPHRDHRIAMAFAVLGLCSEGVTILDAECVGKSYPSFWSDLQSLGAGVTMA
jgi:3-phosphoshikimate 1-carboxyvinyltransferase